MKREFLKAFEGLADDVIDKIMAENGKDIENTKNKFGNIETELKTAKDTITNMTSELQTLKDSGANSDEWKSKFEQLDTQIKEEKAQAETARLQAEKQANLTARFNSICVDKDGKPLEFTHEAIKNEYLKKFGEALENKDNVGKSDMDVFYALTKDDSTAFKGVTTLNLQGANHQGNSGIDDDKIKQIMGIK